MTQETGSGFLSIREIAAIGYRYRYWLIVPALVGLAAAVILLLFMTPKYRSASTVLITSQQIPSSVISSPTASMVDERIGKIRQQILSRENLTRIITAMDLYPSERSELPLDTVIGMMRQEIGVDLVSSAARRPDGGATIAFELSYQYENPGKAQAVTQELTRMFLAEDKKLRTEQVMGTAAFLSRRANELREQLVSLAAKRREIEARYAGALPEQVALSTQAGASLRAEVSRIDAEGQGLMQQNGLLAARGEELAAQPLPGTEAIRRAEERLNQLRTTYSDNFPDVARAREALELQREMVRRNQTAPPGSGAIAAEISAGRDRIGQLASRRAALVQDIGEMEHMVARAPQASFELANLQREQENLRVQYQGIRDKQMEAQVAANLQKEDKGERFMIVDPPSFPNTRLGPGSLQIVAGGATAGLVMALVLLIGWLIVTRPVQGIGGVTRIMGTPPLIIVPVLRSGNGPGSFDKLRAQFARLSGASAGGN